MLNLIFIIYTHRELRSSYFQIYFKNSEYEIKDVEENSTRLRLLFNNFNKEIKENQIVIYVNSNIAFLSLLREFYHRAVE